MKNVMKKLNKKGFTLAELLIVVAIIAVLVAISIPIFSAQLEKSREAVDAANLRAAYAQVMTSVLTDDLTDTSADANKGIDVTQKQTVADWQTTFDFPNDFEPTDPEAKGTWLVKWDATNNKVITTYTAS